MENSLNLVRELLTSMVATLPKLLGCIIILILGYIVAKIVATVVKTAVSRVGIDKFGEKLEDIDFIQKNNLKIKISSILSKILYFFILLIFIVAATDVLGMPALSDLFKNMLNYIPNVVVAIVMLMIGVLVGDSLRKGIETTGKSLGIPSASILANAFFYFILINFLMAALGQLKIDTQFIESNILIAVAGISLAFAIGYGLASKNILANLVSGFYTKDKFSIGDEITVDGARGQIIKMDRSSLTLLQANNEKTIVPMSKLTNDNVIIHKEALAQLETIEVKRIE